VNFFPSLAEFFKRVVAFFAYIFEAYFSKFLPKLAGYQNVAMGFGKPAVSDGVNPPYRVACRFSGQPACLCLSSRKDHFNVFLFEKHSASPGEKGRGSTAIVFFFRVGSYSNF
jgi:hypothetical protein